jgi:hypothetical protein
MSSFQKFAKLIAKQSIGFKLSLVACALGIIAVFMPWYTDLDKFNSGFRFSGVNGPLYMVGTSLLLMFVFYAVDLVSQALGKKVFIFAFHRNFGQIVAGFFGAYLIFIAYSVFFHPQFGLHIVDKQAQIGILISFVSTLLLSYGGFLVRRDSLKDSLNTHQAKLDFERTHSKVQDVISHGHENSSKDSTHNF